MSIVTPRTMKIIKPPASLEYTEVIEPVAQAYGMRLRFFSVLSRAQPEWLNLYFSGSRHVRRDTRNNENIVLAESAEFAETNLKVE
ncbi:MAG: hypothetical protein A2096_13060 [Spirochaetes bacterium GWF1_41_5]|nr:MAG: hypothetical protein A2096_13060 [Spirochaetes bacterium GWF1_41_5]